MPEFPLVTFLPGNGKEYRLWVRYIADFAIGPDGTCAFCLGDPCAEREDAPTRIKEYFASNDYAATCPFCQGRPS